MEMKHKNEKGYVLFYVIIAGSLFAGLATSVLISTLRELEISEQEMNAVKARFAAEAGVECITYWQTTPVWPRPLDSTGPQTTIYCNTLSSDASFTSLGPDGDPDCEEYNGTFSIGPFAEDNDQCAEVVIDITESVHVSILCSTHITAHGYSDCSASPQAQRTIWNQI